MIPLGVPVPLVDKVPPGEEVGLEVPVQHVLHDGVDGLVVRAHAQQLHDVLDGEVEEVISVTRS